MGLFYIIGSDKRMEYMREMFKSESTLTSDLSIAKYVVMPTPFTKDNIKLFGTDILIEEIIPKCKNKIVFGGAIPSFAGEMLKKNNIYFYDLMEYDDVAILNSIPTAEGALGVAMEMSDITLHRSNALVLGYGRIGKVLCKMLQGIGANVYCEARSEKDLAQISALGYNGIDLKDLDKYLSKFDFVFNTIPYLILTKERLNILKKEVCIIDLASKPGGTDFEYAKELRINVNHALALPSKVASKTAGVYLKQKIDKLIQNM